MTSLNRAYFVGTVAHVVKGAVYLATPRVERIDGETVESTDTHRLVVGTASVKCKVGDLLAVECTARPNNRGNTVLSIEKVLWVSK